MSPVSGSSSSSFAGSTALNVITYLSASSSSSSPATISISTSPAALTVTVIVPFPVSLSYSTLTSTNLSSNFVLINSRISSTVSVIVPSGVTVNGILNSSPTVNVSRASNVFWSSSEITTPSTWISLTVTSYWAVFPAIVNSIVAVPSYTQATL